MASQFRAQTIMGLIIKVLHKKEKIVQVLDYIDADELESGKMYLHQDILNNVFKMDIMNRAPIEDYKVDFKGGSIIISVDKFIKVMMLEKILKFKITLAEPELAFGISGHYFFAKYSIDIDGIPAMLEKMPGGSSIKDTIISTILKNGIKDMAWIQLINDRVYFDFSKAPGFDNLRDQGIYGVDVINTIELGNIASKDGKLMISYKWLES